ncbi:MAG: ComEA family DNA-binding protein, partial [Flavobacteriales bacterium]
ADQIELEKIPGVGPFYAKNILKYRERLGGFVKKEQLLEVWKMDVEKYNAIEMFVEVQGNQVRKITLNTATAEELKSHPYLNWNIANSIVKIRVKKGKFTTIDDIRESVLIDEELFEKIKPYLSL